MKLYRVLSLIFAFILVFSTIPNLAAAADSSATVEKLIKTAEAQSSKLVKQMSSSNSKDINVISTQTSNNLNIAIKKAKASLNKFKGKQKATFEKRIKTVEQTVVNVKTYNTTITNGNTLSNHLTTFKKAFESKPFQTEKLFTDLKTKNDQFTKGLTKLVYKGAQTAFSTKYQTEVNNELKSKKEFFDINKRIDSFMDFTKTNDEMDVWEEFYAIDEVIYDSLLTENTQELLYKKWHTTYYSSMVAPEEENIKKYVNDFFKALNARDAKAIAELYPTENEEQKQALIDIFTYVFAELPETYKLEITNINVEFVYNDEASVYVELVETQDGTELVDNSTMFLTRAEGKWIFIDDTSEEFFD